MRGYRYRVYKEDGLWQVRPYADHDSYIGVEHWERAIKLAQRCAQRDYEELPFWVRLKIRWRVIALGGYLNG